MSTDEEQQAYEVLAKRFGFSADYIRTVLEYHFEFPSVAGSEHSTQPHQIQEQDETEHTAWGLDEIRDTFANIDRLRARGLMPPLKQYIEMDIFRRKGKGKYYIASEEQLQQELELQRNSSIDADGNLVQNGQIVKYGWLQSFAKRDYE